MLAVVHEGLSEVLQDRVELMLTDWSAIFVRSHDLSAVVATIRLYESNLIIAKVRMIDNNLLTINRSRIIPLCDPNLFELVAEAVKWVSLE